jgi:hypothetical protein
MHHTSLTQKEKKNMHLSEKTTCNLQNKHKSRKKKINRKKKQSYLQTSIKIRKYDIETRASYKTSTKVRKHKLIKRKTKTNCKLKRNKCK